MHPWLTLLLLLVSVTSSAQIVNIEDKRKRLDSLGWFGQFDLTGSYVQNRNTVLTVGGGLRLDRLGRRGNVLFLSDYRLVQVSGDNAVNAGFGHLRYGYEPTGRDGWRWETFGQAQYNEQLRLTLRLLIGTGVRRRLYRGPQGRSRAYLGLLYMYEYDELDERSIVYRDHRLSSYLTLRLQLSPTLAVASTTYYQPHLLDFDLPRISTVANVSLKVLRTLALTSNFSLTHDERVNRDLPDVPATVVRWTNGVRLTW